MTGEALVARLRALVEGLGGPPWARAPRGRFEVSSWVPDDGSVIVVHEAPQTERVQIARLSGLEPVVLIGPRTRAALAARAPDVPDAILAAWCVHEAAARAAARSARSVAAPGPLYGVKTDGS
jgi:hypothetical protein